MKIIDRRYVVKRATLFHKVLSETLLFTTQTFELLKQTYGENALSRARVFDWHRRFKEGHEDVEDEEGRGPAHPSITTMEKAIRENPRLSVWKVGAMVGISRGSANSILTNQLRMRRLCAKWVPHLLTPLQKEESSKDPGTFKQSHRSRSRIPPSNSYW